MIYLGIFENKKNFSKNAKVIDNTSDILFRRLKGRAGKL